MDVLPKPNLMLSKNVVKLWVLSHLISNFFVIIFIISFLFLSIHFNFHEIVNIILCIVLLLVFLLFFIEFIFILRFKYNIFKFDIGEKFLQIKKGGVLYKEHIIVPIKDIYFFDVYQNPLMKKYDLYTLKFKTIAYTHEISGISSERVNQYLKHLSQNKMFNEVCKK